VLARLGRREVSLVGIGAPLHEEFRDALVAAWAAADGAEPLRIAAATLVSWRRWREPTTARVVEWARREDHPVLAVVDDDGRARHDAVLQLTALRVLAERQSVVMVTFDGIDLFARRSFLAHTSAGAGGGVPVGIVAALADDAAAIGYEVVADPELGD